jgi:hypothetical protein
LSVPGAFPPANVAKIVDAQVYMGRNQTNIVSLRMHNEITPNLTSKHQETEKRNLGTVYADNFIADQLQGQSSFPLAIFARRPSSLAIAWPSPAGLTVDASTSLRTSTIRSRVSDRVSIWHLRLLLADLIQCSQIQARYASCSSMFVQLQRFSQWLIIHRTVLTTAQLPAKAFLLGLGPSRSRASRISA